MESQIIEYKQSWRDEFLKEICGFANAQGGTLYIGLDDKGNAVGLQHAKKLLEDIPNQSVMTMGVMPNVNLLNKDGKEYISIEIKPTTGACSFWKCEIASNSVTSLKINKLASFKYFTS